MMGGMKREVLFGRADVEMHRRNVDALHQRQTVGEIEAHKRRRHAMAVEAEAKGLGIPDHVTGAGVNLFEPVAPRSGGHVLEVNGKPRFRWRLVFQMEFGSKYTVAGREAAHQFKRALHAAEIMADLQAVVARFLAGLFEQDW